MTSKRNRAETHDLAKRIARVQGDRTTDPAAAPRGAGNMTGLARGIRLATEFVAAIAVGAVLGFGLDALFGTAPWLMVVMLMFGFAAGVLNVIRATRDMNDAVPPDEASLPDNDE